MDTTFSIDAFNLCWNAILKESQQFKSAFFNKEHCIILDSRDTNFDVVENRLAYTYKYGCYNILFLEKCISDFLNEYSKAEKIFPLENLKVCSLSNGPGLDIIGLLFALCKSNKRLKCFPQLKAVNLYESWLNLYKTVVRRAYEAISLNSFAEYFHISSDNIHLIQSDVFSTLSTEARNCISNSNVLLMVKVFVSSKATPAVFANSLKEIFSLLQPGSLIFFIGTKQNKKTFSKNSNLNHYVKCIFGPQKITLNAVPFDESIAKSIDVKPFHSGYGYFIVWQKRDDLNVLEMIKRKRKRARKKNKTSKITGDEKEPLDDDDDNVDSECRDDTDAGSEISFTSGSKQSDTLSDELKSYSNSSTSNSASPDETKAENSQKKQNLTQNDKVHSIDHITSILDEVNIKDLNYEEQKLKDLQQCTLQSDTDNISNIIDNTQEKKFETRDTENMLEADILSKVHPFFETTYGHFSNISLNEKPQIMKGNVDNARKFKTSAIQKKTELEFLNGAHQFNEIKSGETKISLQVKPQVTEESVQGNKVNYNFTSTGASSLNKIFQTNLIPLGTQSMSHEEISKSPCNKKSKKNKIQSVIKTKHVPSKLNIESESDKKAPKTLQNFSSKNQSCENSLFKFERNPVVPQEANICSSNDRNGPDFHLLLKRCESVVTSLEKLTTDIKNISLLNDNQSFAKKCYCARQACGDFRVSHPCSCSVNAMHSCCCRKVCNCKMIQNNCTSCSNSCRSKNLPEFQFDAGMSTNVSRPYVTIPLQNEDIVRILTSRKS